MQKVVIFGTGRGADVATRYLRDDSENEVIAYTIDDAYADRKEFMGQPVVPFSRVERELPPGQCRMFIPMGFQRMNALRAEKFREAKNKGYSLISYVSSRIICWGPPKVGENCLILEANILNYDVTIGDNVVLWSGNQIGDCAVIEDNVWISSHVVLSGEVTIGANSFLGVNAAISNHVHVGPRCYIGANTLITQNTPADSVYVTKGTTRIEQMDSLRFLEMIKA
jgi:sugar O-acyltransferase (sialic acid O-acetyltransferase NeuD family)